MQNKSWEHLSKFDDSDNSLGFLLWKVSIKWRRKIEVTLTKYDLTHTQFVMLATTAYLTRNDNMVTQVEIAEFSSCDINTTSQVLRGLEKRLLIVRTVMDGNEKSKYPKLTDFGFNILKPAIKDVEAIDEVFFSALTNSKKQQLSINLSQLIDYT